MRHRGGPLAPQSRGVRTARRLLLAAAGALLLYLLLAPKPWSASTGYGFFASAQRPMVDVILIGFWWMAIPNALLCLALAVTAGFWAGPAQAPAWPEVPARPRRRGVLFWTLILLAALLGGMLRWNLAHGSLWWDEAWTVKRAVVGHREPVPEDPSQLSFRQVRWHWTFFHYKKPTNHVLYSASARVSNSVWRAWNGREPWAFDEFALRLPAYVAAVASIIGVGLLLRSWVSPAVGVAGAFLLALHPWHVEHGPELRAYGYVGLLGIASCWLLVRLLRKPSPGRIVPFALAQFLLLWTHPFTLYLVASLGLAGVAGLALRGGARPAARLAAALTLAGMAWLQVMAPNLAQTRIWTDVNEPSKGRVVQSRALDSLTGLAFAGLPRKYGVDDPDRNAYPSAESLSARKVWVAPTVYGVLPLLTLLGFARLVARRGPERWAALGLGLAAPLAIAVSWAGQLFFHERFVFYALVAVVVFVPVGLEGLLRGATRPWPRARRFAVPLGLALGLLGFHALVEPRNSVLQHFQYAPMREVAAFTREAAGNDPLSVIRVGYGSGGEMPALYDPWITRVRDAAGIADAMRRARAEDRELLVFYGYPTANRPRLPSGFQLIDDRSLFNIVAHFQGADPHFSYWVLRYRGAPAEG